MAFNIEKLCGVDVDTLNDFMEKDGVLYKPETEKIKSNLRKITITLDKYDDIRTLCFNDAHYGDSVHKEQESELKINGGVFDIHAQLGANGANKIPETMIGSYSEMSIVPNTPHQNLWISFEDALMKKRTIFEKQSIDIFYDDKDNKGGNINIDVALDILGLEDFFVYGVYTEYCIKAAVLGLLMRNKNVWVITDAITPFNINPDDGDVALSDMANMGSRFITTDEFVQLLKNNFGGL